MRFLFAIVLFFPLFVSSQEFTTRIEPSKVKIGEPFMILLETPYKLTNQKKVVNTSLKWYLLRPNLKNNRPDTIDFEWIEKPKDTIRKIQGKVYLQLTAKALCFDTGIFLFAPDSLRVENKNFFVQTGLVQVDLENVAPQQNIEDIKESFAQLPDKPWSFLEFLKLYGWIVLTILAIGLIIHYFRKNRAKEIVSGDTLISNKQKTIIALQVLFAQQKWIKEGLTIHFIETVFILKDFLSTEFGKSLREKTTFEIGFIAKKKKQNEAMIEEIRFLLDVTDLVKFAESQIANEGVEMLNQRILSFVENFESEKND